MYNVTCARVVSWTDFGTIPAYFLIYALHNFVAGINMLKLRCIVGQ